MTGSKINVCWGAEPLSEWLRAWGWSITLVWAERIFPRSEAEERRAWQPAQWNEWAPRRVGAWCHGVPSNAERRRRRAGDEQETMAMAMADEACPKQRHRKRGLEDGMGRADERRQPRGTRRV